MREVAQMRCFDNKGLLLPRTGCRGWFANFIIISSVHLVVEPNFDNQKEKRKQGFFEKAKKVNLGPMFLERKILRFSSVRNPIQNNNNNNDNN